VFSIGGDDTDNDFDDPDLFAVVTGRTQLSSGAGQEIEVIAGYFFEDQLGNQLYNPLTSEWDLFVVELASPSSSETIKVAGPGEWALWTAGRTAHATGWGATANGGATVDLLREVEIGMIADSTCGSPSSYGATFISETMVCAGVIEGGKDACQGDSGGPLVVPTAAGGHRLVGDTSFGAGCAQPNLPGVYGRLADDPIRTALANTVESVAGVNVLGSGAVPPDVDAPETTITSGPSGRTRKRSPKFRFNSSEAGSSFECRLDSGAWAACSSPKTHSKLSQGKHSFEVRATDVVGNTDPTPAGRSFKVDTKLRGSAKAKKTQRQKGSKITVTAKVSAKEKLEAKAGGKVKLGKASYPLRSETKKLKSGRSKKLKLRPKKGKGARKLAAALGSGKQAKASLKVTLTDGAGNKAKKKLAVRLRGRG
jgi:hypothetical protein